MMRILIGIAGSLTPLILQYFGVAGLYAAPIGVAALLVWPGYTLAQLRHLSRSGNHYLDTFIAIPLLSLLVAMLAVLLAWLTLDQIGLVMVNLYIAIIVIGLVATDVALGRFGRYPYERQENNDRLFVGTLVLAAALALITWSLVAQPGLSAAPPTLAVYLDPFVQPSYDRLSGTISVALIVEAPATSQHRPMLVSVAVADNLLLQQRLEIAATEQIVRLEVPVPEHLCREACLAQVHVALEADSQSGPRTLSLWVQPE